MYFIVEDKRSVTLRAQDLGPFFEERLQTALRQQLEGATSKNHDGLIVHLLNVSAFSKPRVFNLNTSAANAGGVTVTCSFRAIVFRPFKNEVIDCVVDALDKNGFFAWFGPMRVFVSRSSMPEEVVFSDKLGTPSFANDDASFRIVIGADVRAKIIGVRRDGTNLYAIGSVDGDYLGPSSLPPKPLLAGDTLVAV